jgi:hypothetical protein
MEMDQLSTLAFSLQFVHSQLCFMGGGAVMHGVQSTLVLTARGLKQ